MRKFIEKLGAIFLGPGIMGVKEIEKVQLYELEVSFLTNKKLILKQIQLCRRSGGLIGVYSGCLGRGMFLTTVEDIAYSDTDVFITFKPYDMSGGFLPASMVSIRDISGICPFNQVYIEPRNSEIALDLTEVEMLA
jgi:hypothetical protein